MAGGSGREVEGFGALAQNQGAKAVIATLWSVADKSTSMFMRDFYRRMINTPDLPKVEALRQTQIAMLRGDLKQELEGQETDESLKGIRKARLFHEDKEKPYAHPFFWAPFILFGNWK